MNCKVEKLLKQCVVRYMDGDFDTFNGLVKVAMELYERDKHLYVPIEELMRAKGA